MAKASIEENQRSLIDDGEEEIESLQSILDCVPKFSFHTFLQVLRVVCGQLLSNCVTSVQSHSVLFNVKSTQ